MQKSWPRRARMGTAQNRRGRRRTTATKRGLFVWVCDDGRWMLVTSKISVDALSTGSQSQAGSAVRLWPFTRSCLALLHGSLPLCRCCWQPRSRCLSTLSNTRVALTWRHFVASCDNGHEAPPYALCQTMRWIAGFKLVLTGRKAIENRVAFSRAIEGRKRRTSMGGHPSTQFSSSLPPQPGDSIFPGCEKPLPSKRCLHKATESSCFVDPDELILLPFDCLLQLGQTTCVPS